MSRTTRPTRDRPDGGGHYEVRLIGHLDDRWGAWFDGSTLSHRPDGTTVIRGHVADQAALYGLLQKVRDVGLALVSVDRIEPDHNPHAGGEAGPRKDT
jgi:hypothetical protein